ncbi:MAG TPA: hypothetical protein VGI50_11465 [Solirubrobacteraceae bacterium]|jgi:hypothetical protein
MSASLEDILAQPVFVEGANVPFGELTQDQVRARAQELRLTTGWGPTARVAPVARAWAELGRAMQEGGAQTVGQLPADVLEPLAPQLWVVMP